MKDFAKRVAAHICTWFIVQPLYNRLLREWRKRELGNPSEETTTYWHEQACAIVDVMEKRQLVMNDKVLNDPATNDLTDRIVSQLRYIGERDRNHHATGIGALTVREAIHRATTYRRSE